MRATILFLSLLLFPCSALLGWPQHRERPKADQSDFILRATVVEALEGGPICVKVSLKNGSKHALTTHYDPFRPSHLDVATPEQWEPRLIIYGVSGNPNCMRTISPGEEWSETLFLYNRYDKISPGTARLTLAWPLETPGRDRKLIARPTLDLDVAILPATPERLDSLRQRLEHALNRPQITLKERRQVVKTIQDSQHAALVPVAWRLLETVPSAYADRVGEDNLFHFVETRSDETDAVHGRFVKLACDSAWAPKAELFNYWRLTQPQLTAEQFQQLVSCHGVWTRALSYIAFPKRHDAVITDGLLVRLRDLNKPLPEAEFTRLLRRLDEENFDLREKASAELDAAGERVEAQLSRSRNQPLSPEVERRVRAALAKLQEAKQPRDCVNTLAYLRGLDTPESQKALEVLAEGTADTWLRKEAAKILAEKKKRAGP